MPWSVTVPALTRKESLKANRAKKECEEKYTHPEIREEIKEEVKQSNKGGESGQ